MARIAYMDDDSASPETKAEWQRMIAARGSGPGNLYRLLGHSPKLMSRWAAFAETVRGIDPDGSVVPEARLRELAIIQVARLTGADYEWSGHVRIAQREGVTDEQVQALLRDDPTPFGPAERALLAYTLELTRNVSVADATAAELKRHFDERQVLELTVTVAFYNCVARVLQGLAIDLEAGQKGIPRPA